MRKWTLISSLLLVIFALLFDGWVIIPAWFFSTIGFFTIEFYADKKWGSDDEIF